MISLTENEFNNHSSVETIETIYSNSSFQFKHINTKEVQDLFENLNPRKSCSDTGLTPKLMKNVAEGIATSFPGSSLYFEKVPWLRLVTCLLDFSRFQRFD